MKTSTHDIYLQICTFMQQAQEKNEAREKYKKQVGSLALQGLRQDNLRQDQRDFFLQWAYFAEEYQALYPLALEIAKKTKEDFPARLAASAAFALKQPLLALKAAKEIQDLENRLLYVKSAELWSDIHSPLSEEPRVHLLILACNREHELELALRELANTKYTNYAVFIADNGSDDKTWDIVQKAPHIFPPHIKVHLERFPTNIGRPAGHNWLLSAHDHSSAEFIAIGDDDLVRIPEDWLSQMIRTAQVFPKAACVGGKALTPGWPLRVHGGIRNFTQFGEGSVDLTNGNEQDDLGQFDYIDMVDHVIGCLHIFRRSDLEETGFFDIRFSPCQGVDIEHHLRMCLAGKQIIFNGIIAFEHLRAMGKAVGKDMPLMGNSIGNIVKLLYKYPHDYVQEKLIARHKERDAWLIS